MTAAMTRRPTLAGLDRFAARLTEGTRLVNDGNTYYERPGGAGPITGTFTVTKPGKRAITLVGDDGRPFHVTLPQRAADVVELHDDRITYLIAGGEYRTSWRIVTD